MKYFRSALLVALNTVKPALSVKGLIEELTHVWFDGNSITAYNDGDLGIQVPFKSDFKGGLPGALLLGLMHNSRAKEVELEPTDDGHMKLVAARTRAKLAVLDADRAVWSPSVPKKKATLELTESFMSALKAVLVSVGNDTSIPEKLGVTLSFLSGNLSLYTTDSKSVCAVLLEDGYPMKDGSLILPTAFCEQLLRLFPEGGSLWLTNDSAMVKNDHGITLFSKLIDCASPLDFVQTIAAHTNTPKDAEFDVPSKLALALDRVMVLLDGVVGESVDMAVFAGNLRLEASVEGRGSIKESIAVPDNVPEMSIRIDPALIKRALPYSQLMVVTDAAVVLYGSGGFVYLASSSGG